MGSRRKNAGQGYGYDFHGAFTDKADAVEKEKQTPGSFIKGMPTAKGYRYIVMTPRKNPRKPGRRNPAKRGRTITVGDSFTEGRGAKTKTFSRWEPAASYARKLAEKIYDRIPVKVLEHSDGAELTHYIDPPAEKNPTKLHKHIKSKRAETAYAFAGRMRDKFPGRKIEVKERSDGSWDVYVLNQRANPAELIVLGANPSRPFIGPGGKVWHSGKRPKSYRVTKEFTGGPLEGMTHTEETTAHFRVGQVVSEPIGGSPYRIIAVEPAENPVGLRRANPVAAPRRNYVGFGPGTHSRRELAASRRAFKSAVREKAKEFRQELRRLRRSAGAGYSGKRNLEKLFHEVYGQNPGDDRYMLEALAQLYPGKTLGQLSTAELSEVAQRAARLKIDQARRQNVEFGEFEKGIFHPWTRRPRSRRKQAIRRHSNPAAAELRETFTGAPAEWVTVSDESHMPAGDYAQLGELLALYVKPLAGGQVQQINFRNNRPVLVSDESARQMYLVGGDQDISGSLDAFGARDRGDGTLELGELRRLDYKQRKEHVADPDVDEWRHELGEENGIRPVLCFAPDAQRLLIVGGDYEVRAEGITN